MFFVHEHALRSLIGGPRVMNEQLLHLLFMGNRPECAIRVVPISAGAAGMNGGGFLIFGYKEDPSLVYVSHATTSEFLRPTTRWFLTATSSTESLVLPWTEHTPGVAC